MLFQTKNYWMMIAILKPTEEVGMLPVVPLLGSQAKRLAERALTAHSSQAPPRKERVFPVAGPGESMLV